MTQIIFQTDISASKNLLLYILKKQCDEKSFRWVQQKTELFEQDFSASRNAFLMAFSGASRFVPKERLQLDLLDVQKSQELRPGLNLKAWTVSQTARCLFLLTIPTKDKETYLKTLERLFDTAEMNELVALYASLPLLAYPDDLKKRAAEGIRTNMTSVFDAVAMDNPFSTDYLNENAWNQLYLKAAFMARPLYRIHGIEQRANAELARIISDYAHERWAAGRDVSPEFWRPVSSFLDAQLLSDLKKLFEEGSELEKQAAALVCYASEHSEAQALLANYPDLQVKASQQSFSWLSIANQLNESLNS